MKERKKFTEEQRTEFRVWLVKNHLSIREFAAKCGISHQYIYKVINGKCNITKTVVKTFEQGGYFIYKAKRSDE